MLTTSVESASEAEIVTRRVAVVSCAVLVGGGADTLGGWGAGVGWQGGGVYSSIESASEADMLNRGWVWVWVWECGWWA